MNERLTEKLVLPILTYPYETACKKFELKLSPSYAKTAGPI